MEKTYDQLTSEDKQKYLTMMIYENNVIKVVSWYIIMMVGILTAMFIMLPLVDTPNWQFYSIYCLLACIILAYIAVEHAIEQRKKMCKIFGLENDIRINEQLFGLTEEETKTSLKDVLHAFLDTLYKKKIG